MNAMISMKKALLGSALALVTLPSLAFATLTLGDQLGSDPKTIIQNLEAAGYQDIEVEWEDGVLEAEGLDSATGEEVEFMIDPSTGEILSTETEVADQDDDEDQDGSAA